MAKVEHYYTRFEEGEFYHVYNRTIDKQPMFKNPDNNNFFLKRFDFFLSDVVTVYVYCLLENHFHFLIKVPDSLAIYRAFHKIDPSLSTHEIVSKQFRRFFQSYALAFNRQQDRCGTLFQTPFKRVRVKSDENLTHLVYYINTNAQKHKLIQNFKNWKWCSYNDMLAENNTDTQKEIVSWFGNKKDYIDFHNLRITNFDNL